MLDHKKGGSSLCSYATYCQFKGWRGRPPLVLFDINQIIPGRVTLDTCVQFSRGTRLG
jgi:hypothetical protein